MKNAFSGYTYQKQVTFLLLSFMDVERNISKIEIEAKTTDNFDDLVITTNSEVIKFQIKDFENIKFDDLSVKENKVLMKGHKPLKLSSKQNIIFFRNISFKSNETVLNFPSYKLANNVSIISLSRIQIDEKIDDLYVNNPRRRNEIDFFLIQSWIKEYGKFQENFFLNLKTL